MMKFRHAMAVLALGSLIGTGCSCEPLVNPPDGGTGGGSVTGGGGGSTGGGTGGGMTGGGGGTTGGGGGTTGGGGGTTGGGGGTTGGGGGTTGGGGGTTGGGGGATGGGGGTVQFTEYVRNLIVTGTNGTTPARPPSEFTALPDDAPVTYTQGFFDGGVN